MRKKVVLDVDGILADFCGAAAATMTRVSGRLVLPHHIDRWEVTDVLDDDGHKAESKLAFQSRGFCSSIDPYPGAAEAVRSISEVADVVYATAPMHKNEHWIRERIEWLERVVGADPKSVVFTYQKHLVSGACILEDSGPNADLWASAHPSGVAMIWDRPYNRHEGLGARRVHSWDDVLGHVYAAVGSKS